MLPGMMMGCGVSTVVNTETPVFSPSELFASGEDGGWYDPSDLSTLWKDTAGTDPVTADGDLVARIDDKSGNGHHLTQTNISYRPLYRTVNGLHWLYFDGVDDYLTGGAVMDLGYEGLLVCAGAKFDNPGAATQGIIGRSGIDTADGAEFRFYLNQRGNGLLGFGTDPSITTGLFADYDPSATAADSKVLTGQIYRHANAGLITIREDGIERDSTPLGDDTATNYSTQAYHLKMGCYGRGRGDPDPYYFFKGRVYGAVIRVENNNSAQEIDDIESWMTAVSILPPT